ncbi:HIT domain-containing protein [candidate division KSB1 bacterium]|nr:HIT domain-containing protein [candidate division KSB1 bacterium]
MKKLWAPWRIEYILQPKPEGCIFCDKPKEKNDRDNLILYRGKTSFVIMNFYPYNNGHLMVVPYRHIPELASLTEEEQAEMMKLLTVSSEILKDVLNAEGLNIGMNLGRIAGAGIDDHIHFHIVPRWNGDTNFMPVTGNTRVISQGLYESWDLLYPMFNK